MEQRIGLIQQAVQEYGLSIKEADEIIKETGLIVGDTINYFRVLGLSNHKFENLNETTITSIVDEAHINYRYNKYHDGNYLRHLLQILKRNRL